MVRHPHPGARPAAYPAALPARAATAGFGIVLVRMLTLCASLAILVTADLGLSSSREVLLLYTGLLLAYVTVEIRRAARDHPAAWLAHPTVLASVLTFGLGFGVTNVIYVNDAFLNDLQSLFPDRQDAFRWMNVAMGCVVAAAVAMWAGSDSGAARALVRRLYRSRVLARWLRPTLDVRWGVVWTGVGLSVAARLLLINLGIYGYSGNRDQIYQFAFIREYIDLFGDLGLLGLVLFSLRAFTDRTRGPADIALLAALVAVEAAFGVLSGFKTAAAMPFLIVVFSYYLATRRVSLVGAGVVLVALVVAYQVVEPFRDVIQTSTDFDNTDIGAMASVVASVVQGDADTDVDVTASDALLRAMQRQNTTALGARAVKLSEEGVPTSAGGIATPNFTASLVLAPIYAVVPRVVWPEKPLQEVGLWFNYAIGFEFDNAVSTSSVGYLYLAGGLFAVCLGFFCIGVAQSVVFHRFLLGGGGGILVYLAVLGSLAILRPYVPSLTVELVRTIPLALAVQVLLLRPPAGTAGGPSRGAA